LAVVDIDPNSRWSVSRNRIQREGDPLVLPLLAMASGGNLGGTLSLCGLLGLLALCPFPEPVFDLFSLEFDLPFAKPVFSDRHLFGIRHSLQRIEGKLQLVATKTEESQRSIRLPDLVVSSLIAHGERQRVEKEMNSCAWSLV